MFFKIFILITIVPLLLSIWFWFIRSSYAVVKYNRFVLSGIPVNLQGVRMDNDNSSELSAVVHFWTSLFWLVVINLISGLVLDWIF